MNATKIQSFVLTACLAMIILAPGCLKMSHKVKPGAPGNLVGIAISHREIQLTWQDNSDNEDGFRVACTIHGGSKYYEIGDLPANTTSFVHSELDPLETYSYYVQAYNNFGEASSSEIEVTTLSGVTILDDWLYEKHDGTAAIAGLGRNDTNEMIDSIYITVWWYDASGILLNTNYDLIADVPAGVIFEFQVRSSIWLADVDHYDIKVTDVNI